MFKKAVAVLLAVLMLSAALAGCGNHKSSKDSVSAVFGPEPETIDPSLNQTADGSVYISNAFEGLTRNIKGGKVGKGIAKRWDISNDRLTYTFHLREAEWSDGRPVKAQDFVYAWRRILDPKTASPYNYIMFYIKNGEKYSSGKAKAEDVGVKALDDKTLQVTLAAPATFFLELCSLSYYVPLRKDIIDKYGDKWTQSPGSYVSDGAFKLKEWKHNDELVFEKNDRYWDASNVILKKVNFKLMSSDATALTAFESGDIDVDYMVVPQEEIPNLLKNGKAAVYPELSTYFYDFNVTKPPFDNVNVRKAFALAIDRQYLCDRVALAGQKPALGFVPYGFINPATGKDFREEGGSYLPAVPSRDDMNNARKLMAEAGYPNGKGFPQVELKYTADAGNKRLAEAVQSQLKTGLNIDLSLAGEEWKVYMTDIENGNYMMACKGWGTDYTDPISFMDIYTTGGGNNSTGWGVASYDRLIADTKTSPDQKVRFRDMHEAEKILMAGMPVLPVYFYSKVVMEDPRLKGQWTTSLGQYFFRNAYFD